MTRSKESSDGTGRRVFLRSICTNLPTAIERAIHGMAPFFQSLFVEQENSILSVLASAKPLFSACGQAHDSPSLEVFINGFSIFGAVS